MSAARGVRTIIRPVNKGTYFGRFNQFWKEVSLEDPAITFSFFLGGLGVAITWLSMPNVRGILVPFKSPKQSWFGEHY